MTCFTAPGQPHLHPLQMRRLAPTGLQPGRERELELELELELKLELPPPLLLLPPLLLPKTTRRWNKPTPCTSRT